MQFDGGLQCGDALLVIAFFQKRRGQHALILRFLRLKFEGFGKFGDRLIETFFGQRARAALDRRRPRRRHHRSA